MKPDQRSRYAARIERAIALLERSLATGEAPVLADLAAAAAMSEFHFHRIFRLMTGEAPGAAITRARLAGSLPVLSSHGIGAATGQSGYATSQAYARALRAATGQTPSALGSDAQALDLTARALAEPSGAQETPLRIEIVELAPLRLLAVRNVGAYAELNRGFGHLFGLVLAQIGPESLQAIWGMPLDDPRFARPENCSFICALDTGGHGEATGDLEEHRLPGGHYLSFSATGNYDALHDRIDVLYIDLLERDLPLGDGPVLINYLDDADEVSPPDQRAHVYLPLAAE
ncbi:AraC family transcriptional regulator [Novosphingobium taihuense]|uniref:AraC family transcriptional regulator n=1 Tax=Novosphingobium taihuense TaxID=260085 RepID=A0A7W7A8T0_9SPHN|nr:AraC family transcriptional regulator [Novosphingobium taihuense]MBB4612519.1 AraC family transcriptional regulator [Novosphingobium taihuense]TWH88129.1 AraC family transcriptional regulator [Novosphingobium taihuense]